MRYTVGCILLLCQFWLATVARAQTPIGEEARIEIDSDGWRLVGDLLLPTSPQRLPAVLLLNRAAGDRRVYTTLASELARRGIATLRLDMRGHGESTNLGRFVPGDTTRSEEIIWNAEVDVIAATRYLRSHPRIDAERIGVVGASYSGEEMAEAGRIDGYARAYVALSPGSFSDESIEAIDASGVPWFFIVSKHERYLDEIAAAIQARSRTAEILYIPGDRHATNILLDRPDLAERTAIWFARILGE